MDIIGLQELAVVAASTLLVLSGAALLVHMSNSAPGKRRKILQDAEAELAFLFDGTALVDATRPGWRTFQQAPNGASDLDRLQGLLLPRFPDLRGRMRTMEENDRLTLDATDNTAELVIENWDGLTRLHVTDSTESGSAASVDVFTLRALEDEVQTLRSLAEDTPYLIWQTDPDGVITWANSSYLELHAKVSDAQSVETWPPAQVFEAIQPGPYPSGGLSRRVSVVTKDSEDRHWFDALSVSRGVGAVHFATSADSVVQAELAQRNFVQTLTKTFAQLSIGLTIFDKDRHLVLFNPALLDLLKVPVEFLSQRPSLESFLDRLREEQLIPEPKNYKSWRQQISDLEMRAKDGTYCEVWTLPGGLTYRVTGRPHPDGAIAFLFEDISAEVSLTRRFRSEINLRHAVIDAMPDAIAVFAADGVVTLTNQAYRTLWNITEDAGFIEQNIIDAISQWQTLSAPQEDWTKIRDSVLSYEGRRGWDTPITFLDGRVMTCRIAPLTGGDTMVSFSQSEVPNSGVNSSPKQALETALRS